MRAQTFASVMPTSLPSRNQWWHREKMAFSRANHPVERLFKSANNAAKMCNLYVIRCGASFTEQRQVTQFDDGYYMRRCVDLAKRAIGCTSPNPMVGCLILKDGEIVGEGYHPKAGQPHAEVFALRDAGDAAENGTAYVTLEPCNHYGRTPPCTEALIKAKVRRVVVGMVDPNPIVASTGLKKLQDAGIEVIVGVEEDLCRGLNEAYIHRMLTGKPFVALRYSMSLDGFVVNNLSEGAAEAGGYYSKLLQEYDAVILSSKALSRKFSWPISKEPGANQPLKIVLWDDQDPEFQIPALDSHEASNVTIISKRDNFPESESILQVVQRLSFDGASLPSILDHCYTRGLCSVLLDLSGENGDFEGVLKEGFEENLFQKVIVDVLPFMAGPQGRVLKFHDLNAKVKNLRSRSLGKSILLEAYF